MCEDDLGVAPQLVNLQPTHMSVARYIIASQRNELAKFSFGPTPTKQKHPDPKRILG